LSKGYHISGVLSLPQPLHTPHLNVKDNGVGFDLERVMNTRKQSQAGQAKWGLLGIEERVALANGQFKITSKPGQGTQLDVRIPVLNQEVSYEQDQVVIG